MKLRGWIKDVVSEYLLLFRSRETRLRRLMGPRMLDALGLLWLDGFSFRVWAICRGHSCLFVNLLYVNLLQHNPWFHSEALRIHFRWLFGEELSLSPSLSGTQSFQFYQVFTQGVWASRTSTPRVLRLTDSAISWEPCGLKHQGHEPRLLPHLWASLPAHLPAGLPALLLSPHTCPPPSSLSA